MMNRKKQWIAALGLSILVGLASSKVQAEEIDSGTTEATVTFEGGLLTLDQVPISINFDNHQVSLDTEIYFGTIESEEEANAHLEVSDLRGTWEGWRLTAEIGPFVHNGNEAEETSLRGSILRKGAPTHVTNSTISEEIPQTFAVELVEGVETIVANALEDTGMGWNGFNWSNGTETISLEIPAGAAVAGNHTSTITWILSDAPQ